MITKTELIDFIGDKIDATRGEHGLRGSWIFSVKSPFFVKPSVNLTDLKEIVDFVFEDNNYDEIISESQLRAKENIRLNKLCDQQNRLLRSNLDLISSLERRARTAELNSIEFKRTKSLNERYPMLVVLTKAKRYFISLIRQILMRRN